MAKVAYLAVGNLWRVWCSFGCCVCVYKMSNLSMIVRTILVYILTLDYPAMLDYLAMLDYPASLTFSFVSRLFSKLSY